MLIKALHMLIRRKFTVAGIIGGIFVILFAARIIHRFFTWNPSETEEAYEEAIYEHNVKVLNQNFDSIDDISQPGSYNFQKMLALINLARNIKQDINRSYRIFQQTHQVRKADVELIIDELIREKERLRRHIWDLKGHAKASISIKKYRQLHYYLEVMDNSIVDMNSVLQEIT